MQNVTVITFDSDGRLEPKVFPPGQNDIYYGLALHYGDTDLLTLRMSKGQMVSVYGALRSALANQHFEDDATETEQTKLL